MAKAAKARAKSSKKRSPKLTAYRRKRDFRMTPEPAGEQELPGDLFVVQKHAARRLHYDFRLALDGTLKSWAVTKGPSLDPKDRRLAVHVEDHPMDYATFEGVIPKGQYGGGTVMVWDVGRWKPIGDPRKGYQKGHMDFELTGKKLHGRWHLVRMHVRPNQDGQRDNWLLIKGNDEYARARKGEAVLANDRSGLTGRSLEGIASDTASSNADTSVVHAKSDEKRRSHRPPPSKGSDPLPEFIAPQLATLVAKPPTGSTWIHEVKFDGYRMLCRIEDGACRLLTRRGNDWTKKVPKLAGQMQLPVRTAAIDGEVVALDDKGVSSFGLLQTFFAESKTDRLSFFAFDLLHLDGVDLRSLPLIERKERLRSLLKQNAAPDPLIYYSEHFRTDGKRFFENACEMALEGTVSKRMDAPYRSGRGPDWLKTKCQQRQEFVIGGFTERASGPSQVGALLLGYYDDGKLAYAGKVGAALGASEMVQLRKRLDRSRIDRSPFSVKVPATRDTNWVRPEAVCEVDFHNWTSDGRLRQGRFEGLRLDKPAREVVREVPTPLFKAPLSKARSGIGRHGEKPGATGHRSARQKPRSARAKGKSAEVPSGAGDLPRLTHPDRVLFAAQGLTKQGLADYYIAVADTMLPHLERRPLVLVRCPEGRKGACFYQKHPTAGMSDALHRVKVREKTKAEEYIFLDDLHGLIELVQFGTLEIHVWGSTVDDIERPDRIIFDLDPGESVPWPEVIEATREMRSLLDDIGLTSFPKTTGGKGLHVVTPIEPSATWAVVKDFARTLAEIMAARHPERYTTNMSKRVRKGRIFIDYLRNDRGATAIAPFSTRARTGAPVAVPLAWPEVTAHLSPTEFTVDAVRTRLRKLRKDPWEGFLNLKQSVQPLIRSLKEHRKE